MHIRSMVVATVLLVVTTVGLGAGPTAGLVSPAPIRINEFLADNDTVIADEQGEYDDVLELYNAGATSVDLGGMYLTDDLGDPTKFRITDTITLPPGGLILFWADDSPEQGIYHANFALSKAGESIGLFDTDANGNAPVDTYSFGGQATDVSEGRCPDGGPLRQSRWAGSTGPATLSSGPVFPRGRGLRASPFRAGCRLLRFRTWARHATY